MKLLLLVVLLGTVANARGLFWEKPDTPEWDQLSVTWGKFSTLPLTQKEASSIGWQLSASCNVNNSFAGNRYVLKGDTATMLLFDSSGKIAGIQMGISKSKVPLPKSFPWISEGDNYVITAYFTDPATICAGSRPTSSYLGDRLLIQTGPKPSDNMAIPFKEEDLTGSKWVFGKCFYSMGQHYWYDISADMDCKNFYPVFVMYNKKRLNGFGWDTQGYVDSPRYEHPPISRLSFFFQPKTHPKCLDKAAVRLTTQHVFLDKRPYFNFC